MVAIGISEIIVSSFSISVSLLADGIHSIATASIFLVVWVGLRLSGRSPDGTFHFGYYRVQTLGSLIAAFMLTVFGGFVLIESYNAWTEQRVIANADAAIAIASIASIVALLVTLWIGRAAKKYGSAALKTGRLIGAIDVLSSIAVVVGVFLSKYFGIIHADSISGVLIAAAIFVGAYSIFRESSLVLVDACKCGDIVNAIGDIAKSVKGVKEVHSIRMRQLGPYVVGDLHIVVDSNMLVLEADDIATKMEEKIRKEFGKILEITVRIESDKAHDRHSKEFIIKTTKST